jgi:hypothetical protein
MRTWVELAVSVIDGTGLAAGDIEAANARPASNNPKIGSAAAHTIATQRRTGTTRFDVLHLRPATIASPSIMCSGEYKGELYI